MLDKLEAIEQDGTSQTIAIDLTMVYHLQPLSFRLKEEYKKMHEISGALEVDYDNITLIKLSNARTIGLNKAGYPTEALYTINGDFETIFKMVNERMSNEQRV
tara:strand:+ start:3114 stop:3422 length:309 start_codon:yes stop_codon:yes gene_type:complete